jgi:uncharacterized protein YbcI
VIRDSIIVCVTEDTMTKAERRLTEAGEAELVDTVRRKFQQTMRDDLVSGIELLTGRRVVSFLSDHNAETDHAAEVFLLDGPPQPSDASMPAEDDAPAR